MGNWPQADALSPAVYVFFCGSLVSVAVVIKRRGVFCTETDIVLCKYRPIVHCNLNKDDVKLSNSCVLFYY